MSNNNFSFLIIGAGRGGTSLLAGLLDYHTQVEVAFELFATDYLMGQQLTNQETDIFQQRVTAFIHGCQQTAQASSKPIWANKITTEQIASLESYNQSALDSLFNQYLKNIKVIFILRDGRSCVNSKVQRTGQPMQTACERWLYSVKCYQFFLQRSNSLCIKFEDLLYQPKTVLNQVCDFLNIAYQDAMLAGISNNKMLPDYQNSCFDITKTQSISLPDEFLQLIDKALRACSYL
jgi:hypothetical protein